MKIRFVRPLPRIDHVIPAGFILDAPEGFARKMIRSGRAVAYESPEKTEGKGAPVPTLQETDRQGCGAKLRETPQRTGPAGHAADDDLGPYAVTGMEHAGLKTTEPSEEDEEHPESSEQSEPVSEPETEKPRKTTRPRKGT